MSLRQAFDEFMKEDFRKAVDKSTEASWRGSSYSVELFDTGLYRVQWTNLFGNLYDSPGLVLQVPYLGEDEWDDDPDLRFYDNAFAAMHETFEKLMRMQS